MKRQSPRAKAIFWLTVSLAAVFLLTFALAKVGSDRTKQDETIKGLEKQNQDQKQEIQKVKKQLSDKREQENVQRSIQVIQQPARSEPVQQLGTGIVAVAHTITTNFFGEGEWYAMDQLIKKESNYQNEWNHSGSGACGLPQALPCSKLPQGINTPLDQQIVWMCNYIRDRYSTPTQALAFHNYHGWY